MKSNLEIRRTFKYNTAYSHLDEWEEIGVTRFLGVTREKKDEESVRSTKLFSVNSDASDEEIRQALMGREAFACNCEHDCCGHLFGSATNARKVPKSKMWLVKVSAYRNF